MQEKNSSSPVKETEDNVVMPKSAPKRWRNSIGIRIINWVPAAQLSRGVRSPHFWIIVALMAFFALIYYAGYTPLANLGSFLRNDFPHDLHRAFFLLPVIYTALLFRFWGALGASVVFLGIVLPRTLYSPYADPLIRPLLFVLFTALIGMLAAILMDQIDEERAITRRLKESQEQLIHAEKLTSVGQLAASVAHEINNPLAGVLTYTKLLAKKIAGDTLRKEDALGYLSKMESEINRCSRIIRNLLDFSRQAEPRLKLVDINQVLEQVLAMVGHQAQMQKVEIVREFGSPLPEVMADFDQLQQVFMNLALNAIQAMSGGGKLSLRTLVIDGEVKIDIQDTGSGISRENLSKLFTPFFTTKGKGLGVGLGLAVVQSIVERHKGKIRVQSEVGRGTTFSVYFNVCDGEKGQNAGV
jgi:signal transduction histidine kinase